MGLSHADDAYCALDDPDEAAEVVAEADAEAERLFLTECGKAKDAGF
jgi:hypothetical protein